MSTTLEKLQGKISDPNEEARVTAKELDRIRACLRALGAKLGADSGVADLDYEAFITNLVGTDVE